MTIKELNSQINKKQDKLYGYFTRSIICLIGIIIFCSFHLKVLDNLFVLIFVFGFVYYLLSWIFSLRELKILKRIKYNHEKQQQNQHSSAYWRPEFDDYFKDFDDLFKKAFGKDFKSNFNGNLSYTSPSKLKNAYILLKLKNTDSEDIIKKRYKELAIKWHPDKWIGNTDKNIQIANRNFQKLSAAYDLIKKDKNIN